MNTRSVYESLGLLQYTETVFTLSQVLDLSISEHHSDEWLIEIDVEANQTKGRPRGVSGIWSSRGVLFALIARDTTSRYRRTILGATWAVIQPAIFTVILSLVHKGDSTKGQFVPYPVYVYSGFLIWTFFSSALQGASSSVVSAQGLVSASYFPRHVLPWVAVGLQIVDLAVGLLGLGGLMVIYRVPPSPRVVLLPLVVALLALGAGGVGSLLAGLMVVARDVGNITPFLSLAWLFATPALYLPPSVLAATPWYQGGMRNVLAALNPLSGLLDLVRYCTFGGNLNFVEVGVATLTTLVFVIAGHMSFAHFEARFTDVL